LGGAITLTNQGLDFEDLPEGRARPQDVLDIFGHSLHLGEPLSLAARRDIEAGIPGLQSFAATAEGGKRAFDLLVKTLLEPHGGAALTDMLETGVLGAVIPEFGRVQHMVQYDVFHIHPVGRHTLETILELKKMALPDHPYHEFYVRLPNPERLLLGALFHDIGKGLGGAHSEKGADLAREALTRIGLDEEAASDVSFLVLRHLLLADTAIRRDISDRDVLAACAQRVGTPERLDMILLLTGRPASSASFAAGYCPCLKVAGFSTLPTLMPCLPCATPCGPRPGECSPRSASRPISTPCRPGIS
jgi:[protein-PII] uridylyltransferase